MGDVLLWIAAAFAALGVPPLLIAGRELRRERREAEQLRRQRSEDSDGEQDAPANGAPGSSSSAGTWPGMFVVACLL